MRSCRFLLLVVFGVFAFYYRTYRWACQVVRGVVLVRVVNSSPYINMIHSTYTQIRDNAYNRKSNTRVLRSNTGISSSISRIDHLVILIAGPKIQTLTVMYTPCLQLAVPAEGVDNDYNTIPMNVSSSCTNLLRPPDPQNR